jgi:hypothetical protein
MSTGGAVLLCSGRATFLRLFFLPRTRMTTIKFKKEQAANYDAPGRKGALMRLCSVCLFAISTIGCSETPGDDISKPKLTGRQEWTLRDGSALVAMIEEKPIDQYSVTAALIVHHRFDPSTQSEVQTLSYRFANPESSAEWREIRVRDTKQTGDSVTQIYVRPFSAPDQSIIEFRILKNGQVEGL